MIEPIRVKLHTCTVHHTYVHSIDPIDRMGEKERRPLLDASFRTLLKYARQSDYYGKVIADAEQKLDRPLDGLEDLSSLPVLTRELMESHMPPHSNDLLTLTQGYKGGYVSRSGGSTGNPKYSIYDAHDWEEMISHAEKLMLATGLAKGDRLANCMNFLCIAVHLLFNCSC